MADEEKKMYRLMFEDGKPIVEHFIVVKSLPSMLKFYIPGTNLIATDMRGVNRWFESFDAVKKHLEEHYRGEIRWLADKMKLYSENLIAVTNLKDPDDE